MTSTNNFPTKGQMSEGRNEAQRARLVRKRSPLRFQKLSVTNATPRPSFLVRIKTTVLPA